MAFWHWIAAKLTGEASSEYPVECGSIAACEPGIAGSAAGVAVLDFEPAECCDEAPWWAPPNASLTELTAPARPELTPEARALENLLLLHFDGRNLELPGLPHVPERVLQLMGQRHFAMTQVSTEIGMDQVAAAAVLRVANSPIYCGVNPTTSLESAVVRLGTQAIRTLMMNLSMRSVAFRERRKGNNFAETLWQRALAGGHVMRLLSPFTRTDPEAASLIGLMHDVGSIIVLRIMNQQCAVTGHPIEAATFEYLCHESHQEFGELLAEAWSLPPQLKAMVTDHHGYPTADDALRVERLQLQVSDMICALLGYAPHVPYDLLATRPVIDLELANRPDFRQFLLELPEQLSEALDAAL